MDDQHQGRVLAFNEATISIVRDSKEVPQGIARDVTITSGATIADGTRRAHEIDRARGLKAGSHGVERLHRLADLDMPGYAAELEKAVAFQMACTRAIRARG